MEIRRLTSADAPAAAALEAACFPLGADAAALARMADDGAYTALCADEDGELLGFGYFQSVLDEGYVGDVAVWAEHRRRGVGRAIVEAMLEAGRAQGLAFLTLEVREGNLAARRLYELCGFETVGRRKNYYERPTEDAVLMTAFLGARG